MSSRTQSRPGRVARRRRVPSLGPFALVAGAILLLVPSSALADCSKQGDSVWSVADSLTGDPSSATVVDELSGSATPFADSSTRSTLVESAGLRFSLVSKLESADDDPCAVADTAKLGLHLESTLSQRWTTFARIDRDVSTEVATPSSALQVGLEGTIGGFRLSASRSQGLESASEQVGARTTVELRRRDDRTELDASYGSSEQTRAGGNATQLRLRSGLRLTPASGSVFSLERHRVGDLLVHERARLDIERRLGSGRIQVSAERLRGATQVGEQIVGLELRSSVGSRWQMLGGAERAAALDRPSHERTRVFVSPRFEDRQRHLKISVDCSLEHRRGATDTVERLSAAGSLAWKPTRASSAVRELEVRLALPDEPLPSPSAPPQAEFAVTFALGD